MHRYGKPHAKALLCTVPTKRQQHTEKCNRSKIRKKLLVKQKFSGKKQASQQTNKSHKNRTQTSRNKRFKNSCKSWQCWWYFRWSGYYRTGQFTAIDNTVDSFSFFQWLHCRQDSIILLCNHTFLSSSGACERASHISVLWQILPCPTLPKSSIYSPASAQPNSSMRSCSTLTWHAEFWAAVQKGKKFISVKKWEMFRCKPILIKEQDFQVQNQRRWE